MFAVASNRAKSHLQAAVTEDPELRRLLEAVEQRQLDPLSAVREIMEHVFHLEAGVRPLGSDPGEGDPVSDEVASGPAGRVGSDPVRQVGSDPTGPTP